jgi:hypothetical protein
MFLKTCHFSQFLREKRQFSCFFSIISQFFPNFTYFFSHFLGQKTVKFQIFAFFVLKTGHSCRKTGKTVKISQISVRNPCK